RNVKPATLAFVVRVMCPPGRTDAAERSSPRAQPAPPPRRPSPGSADLEARPIGQEPEARVVAHQAHAQELELAGGLEVASEDALVDLVGEAPEVQVRHPAGLPRLVEDRRGPRMGGLVEQARDLLCLFVPPQAQGRRLEQEALERHARVLAGADPAAGDD